MKTTTNLIALIALFTIFIHQSECLHAVMSLDLGLEWMKIAIVKPGVPMEIVLNKESRRKTPAIVALKDGERLFGDPAAVMAVRHPKFAYGYALDLLGKTMDNPAVVLFKNRFPQYTVVADDRRNTAVFEHPSGEKYSVEEIIGMSIAKAREYAEDFAEQKIKEALITVPAYFNQAERRSLLHAAEIAGVKVLQLINDNTAVALHYGVFRRKDFNSSVQNIMFYDMGAGSAVATIASYQLVKTKEAGYTETIPQLSIKGVGYDRTLGGLEMQLRLRDHLAKLFTAQAKTSQSVYESPRAMAKLFKEAGKVMTVLSANSEFTAQVESLLDDKDFKSHVTRAEFEELNHDLFDRVANPVKQALTSAEMTLDEINQVIIVGGSTRVPRVQQELMAAIKRKELGKSVNADEAAALGAVYQAAVHSKTFRVKKFGVRDGNLYPIQVEFTRERGSAHESADVARTTRRTLFNTMNPFPQKKVLTFNKHFKDFDFHVSYGDLSFLTAEQRSAFGPSSIAKVNLTGVEAALKKHSDEADADFKGIKAHFKMDDSGIIVLDTVESVFEVPPPPEEEGESTLSRQQPSQPGLFSELGKTFSKMFSSLKGDDNEEEGKEGKQEEEEESSNEEPEEGKDEKVESDAAKEGDAEKEGGSSADQKNDEKADAAVDGNSSSNAATNQSEAAEKSSEPRKPQTIKDPIEASVLIDDTQEMTADEIDNSKAKMAVLDKKDREKAENEHAKNALEAFAIDLQAKLWEPSYESVSTDEERTSIREQLSETSDWLYEDGSEANTDVYNARLKALQDLSADLTLREREYNQRPVAIKSLLEALNYSQTFLNTSRAIAVDAQIFTDVELNTLEKIINETKSWLKQTKKKQDKHPLHSKPVLLVQDLAEKFMTLDREVKYLLNKAMNQPKKKPKNDTLTDDIKIKDKIKSPDSPSANETNETDLNKDETVQTEEQPDMFEEPTDGATDGVGEEEVQEVPPPVDVKEEEEEEEEEQIEEEKEENQASDSHGHEPDDEL